jgi:hypothetical protein
VVVENYIAIFSVVRKKPPKIIYAYFWRLFLAAKNKHFLGFTITPNFNLYTFLIHQKSHIHYIHIINTFIILGSEINNHKHN